MSSKLFNFRHLQSGRHGLTDRYFRDIAGGPDARQAKALGTAQVIESLIG